MNYADFEKQKVDELVNKYPFAFEDPADKKKQDLSEQIASLDAFLAEKQRLPDHRIPEERPMAILLYHLRRKNKLKK